MTMEESWESLEDVSMDLYTDCIDEPWLYFPNAYAQFGKVCHETLKKTYLKGDGVMKKYQVIGGQYEPYWYGESDSLHGAKIIAGKNKEYWDNWQGWHTPKIYKAEDVKEIEAKGCITIPDGLIIRVPKEFAEPL